MSLVMNFATEKRLPVTPNMATRRPIYNPDKYNHPPMLWITTEVLMRKFLEFKDAAEGCFR